MQGAERVGHLAVLQHEARLGVDPPRRGQHVDRPQHHLLAAGLAGEIQTGAHQPPAEPQAAGLRLDIEQAQPPDRLALAHQPDAAEDLLTPRGDPEAVDRRIEPAQEVGGELGELGLVLLVPAVQRGQRRHLAILQPAHVARLWLPQHDFLRPAH
jgi:hypothetical protein